MAGRTLCASEAGIELIRAAMKRDGRTQSQIADALGFSRATLNKILGGQNVRAENLEELCHLFDLEVRQVVTSVEAELDEEKLVQQLRRQIEPEIRKRCGKMKVLDMTQNIDATAIYTDVNILEKITGKNRADLEQLMQGMGPENFDRFALGKVREERVEGLTALARHRLIMILGKPGAGKTTFLKRLAMWSVDGKAELKDKVPIFVTLKEFAESAGEPTLLEYIGIMLNDTSDSIVRRSSVLSASDSSQEQFWAESLPPTRQLLVRGRALILLDGLDEVLQKDDERVLKEIRDFSRAYDQNYIVVTCRIAAKKYIFEDFTEVELANFNNQQIQDFSNKWFKTQEPNKVDKAGQSTISEMFWNELENNQPVKELATNPLLLTLLCLEFGTDRGFPNSRAELYERGIDILFTKWDEARQIKRDLIYKKLPVMRKKAMLAQLAYRTFEKGNYFFKQSVATRQIQAYIQNLPGASTDEEALRLDSSDVLCSIEAQHGLLTQRARGIYSFSHLTFQECFAAIHIANSDEKQNELIEIIFEKRWRETVLLTF